MFEKKLTEARDLVHELLADDESRNLVRVGRILEELCEAWIEWSEDDVAALPSDHNYSVLQFMDDLPF